MAYIYLGAFIVCVAIFNTAVNFDRFQIFTLLLKLPFLCTLAAVIPPHG